MPDEPEDHTITEADLKEAQERTDYEGEQSGTELFSEPVYGPGFRGDLPLAKATPARESAP